MTRLKFRGAGVALITPFREDGSIDETILERLVERQVDGGIDFLVPCGTTGENPALSTEEHFRVVELTVKASDGKVPVLAGAGSNNTRHAVDLALGCIERGANGILSITPYYNKPGPDGLIRHFSTQGEAVDRMSPGHPIIVYNVPGRTGCNISPETLRRIADEIPNVIGVKEASANFDQMATILRERDPDFLVLCGDDAWTVPLVSLGADGVISVAANEIPGIMKQMVAAALDGDFATARSIHDRILPLMTGNFIESNPAPVKAVMKIMGVIPSDYLRSPLSSVSDQSRRRLEAIVEECNLARAD